MQSNARFVGRSRLACCLAGMLKLRGLPFSCTKADIMEWFTDLPVAPIASDGCATVFVCTSCGASFLPA